MTPAPPLTIRVGRPADAEAVAALIASFQAELTLDPTGRGAEAFLASVSPSAERAYLGDARYRYWLLDDAKGDLAGLIALRDTRHVFHLFVDRCHQRQGLARKLWSSLLAHAGPATPERPYTVNASLNAMPVYGAFGFAPTGPVVEQHGIAFQPMRCARTPSD